ncbi:MAG: hypothetical protein VX085_11220, partial [Pseudomonadota bacterium]|nr:hypothetical protein [Pseudomonadota bacterium]
GGIDCAAYVNAKAAEAQAESLMSSYKLIIGSRNYSSWSLRGWLAMQQSGAEFEEVKIPCHTDDRTQLIQAQSPSGLVPVL